MAVRERPVDQLDPYWEISKVCPPLHLDPMPPKDQRKKEGLRTKYDYLRYSYPETYKRLIENMNKQGDPMTMWEDPSMRQPQLQALPAQMPQRHTQEEDGDRAYQRHLEKERQRRELVIGKSRIRKNGGAIITNMEVDRCPRATTRIHSMPKSPSAPSLDTRTRSGKARDYKNKQEEKETVHTLRLAKMHPRNTNGHIIAVPPYWEKVNVAAAPLFNPGGS